MRFRDRDSQEPANEAASPGASVAGDARERARRLLDQADEAIQRALSSDSELFLAQNRQQGGE